MFTNIRREKAWITLTQDNGIIILSVSDNGTVDADVLSSADRLKHRGLAMITERVNDMDGSVTISNNHPHGILRTNDIANERRCFLSIFY